MIEMRDDVTSGQVVGASSSSTSSTAVTQNKTPSPAVHRRISPLPPTTPTIILAPTTSQPATSSLQSIKNDANTKRTSSTSGNSRATQPITIQNEDGIATPTKPTSPKMKDEVGGVNKSAPKVRFSVPAAAPAATTAAAVKTTSVGRGKDEGGGSGGGARGKEGGGGSGGGSKVGKKVGDLSGGSLAGRENTRGSADGIGEGGKGEERGGLLSPQSPGTGQLRRRSEIKEGEEAGRGVGGEGEGISTIPDDTANNRGEDKQDLFSSGGARAMLVRARGGSEGGTVAGVVTAIAGTGKGNDLGEGVGVLGEGGGGSGGGGGGGGGGGAAVSRQMSLRPQMVSGDGGSSNGDEDADSIAPRVRDVISPKVSGMRQFGLSKGTITRAIRKFTSPPTPHPLTVCFHFPGTFLTHRYVLDMIRQKLQHVDGGVVVMMMQFIDRNTIHGAQGLDNRWLVELDKREGVDILLEQGMNLFNRRIVIKRYDEILQEEYAEFLEYLAMQKKMYAQEEDDQPGQTQLKEEREGVEGGAGVGGGGVKVIPSELSPSGEGHEKEEDLDEIETISTEDNFT